MVVKQAHLDGHDSLHEKRRERKKPEKPEPMHRVAYNRIDMQVCPYCGRNNVVFMRYKGEIIFRCKADSCRKQFLVVRK